MARKMTYNNVEQVGSLFKNLESQAFSVCKKGLYDGAGVMADEIRSNTPKSSGDLADSLFVGRFETRLNEVDTVVGFAGYDSNGAPNPLKAAVLESGTSDGTHKATHFFSKSVRAANAKVQNAIGKRVESEIEKITKKG